MTQTPEPTLAQMDFFNQFFQKQHYDAYSGGKPELSTPEIVAERKAVRGRLYDLDKLIRPEIKAQEWDLHPHHMVDYLISLIEHGPYTEDRIGATWLHYGRSHSELMQYERIFGASHSPVLNMRLQVIILNDALGVWLRVGKHGGSLVDREYFRRNMAEDPTYRQTFFELIQLLPDAFFIRINNGYKNVQDFSTPEQLHEYVRHDCVNKHYFVIGRNYRPDDPAISISNIRETVMEGFSKLYPIYQHIKTNAHMKLKNQ